MPSKDVLRTKEYKKTSDDGVLKFEVAAILVMSLSLALIWIDDLIYRTSKQSYEKRS